MGPEEYEHYVASVYQKEGYTITITSRSADGGIDIFAYKGEDRVAIQCKMYGHTNRSVNGSIMRELYGAAAVNECNKIVLVTDGKVSEEAKQIATKLGIEIRYIFPDNSYSESQNITLENHNFECESMSNPIKLFKDSQIPLFDEMWDSYIRALVGKRVYLGNSKDYNIIQSVNNSGLKRISKNGKLSRKPIPIEAFRFAYTCLLQEGEVMRDVINKEFDKDRCSSIVTHVLATLPFIEKIGKAEGLKIMIHP